jgi:hypothetical protein
MTVSVVLKKCGNCSYSQKTVDADIIECKRFPRTHFVEIENDIQVHKWLYPLQFTEDICGEFEPLMVG